MVSATENPQDYTRERLSQVHSAFGDVSSGEIRTGKYSSEGATSYTESGGYERMGEKLDIPVPEKPKYQTQTDLQIYRDFVRSGRKSFGGSQRDYKRIMTEVEGGTPTRLTSEVVRIKPDDKAKDVLSRLRSSAGIKSGGVSSISELRQLQNDRSVIVENILPKKMLKELPRAKYSQNEKISRRTDIPVYGSPFAVGDTRTITVDPIQYMTLQRANKVWEVSKIKSPQENVQQYGFIEGNILNLEKAYEKGETSKRTISRFGQTNIDLTNYKPSKFEAVAGANILGGIKVIKELPKTIPTFISTTKKYITSGELKKDVIKVLPKTPKETLLMPGKVFGKSSILFGSMQIEEAKRVKEDPFKYAVQTGVSVAAFSAGSYVASKVIGGGSKLIGKGITKVVSKIKPKKPPVFTINYLETKQYPPITIARDLVKKGKIEYIIDSPLLKQEKAAGLFYEANVKIRPITWEVKYIKPKVIVESGRDIQRVTAHELTHYFKSNTFFDIQLPGYSKTGLMYKYSPTEILARQGEKQFLKTGGLKYTMEKYGTFQYDITKPQIYSPTEIQSILRGTYKPQVMGQRTLTGRIATAPTRDLMIGQEQKLTLFKGNKGELMGYGRTIPKQNILVSRGSERILAGSYKVEGVKPIWEGSKIARFTEIGEQQISLLGKPVVEARYFKLSPRGRRVVKVAIDPLQIRAKTPVTYFRVGDQWVSQKQLFGFRTRGTSIKSTPSLNILFPKETPVSKSKPLSFIGKTKTDLLPGGAKKQVTYLKSIDLLQTKVTPVLQKTGVTKPKPKQTTLSLVSKTEKGPVPFAKQPKVTLSTASTKVIPSLRNPAIVTTLTSGIGLSSMKTNIIPILITPQTPIITPIKKDAITTKVSPVILVDTGKATREGEIQITPNIFKPAIINKLKDKLMNKQTTTPLLKSLVQPKLTTKTETIFELTQPRLVTPKLITPIQPSTRKPPIPVMRSTPSTPKTYGPISKQNQGYDAMIKKKMIKGKYAGYKKANKRPLTQKAAMGLVMETADKYVNRSGYVKKVSNSGYNDPKLTNSFNRLKYKFRQSKKNPSILVEKSTYAIDSPFEKQGIPFEAMRLRKAGLIKNRKKKKR